MDRSGVGDERSILVLAGGGQICGFDRATGALRWKHVMQMKVLGMTARVPGAVDLHIQGGRVYVAAYERLVCLDYASGTLLGEVPLASRGVRVTFLIDGEQVFVSSSQALECFTLSGERLWVNHRQDGIATDGMALGLPGNVRQGDEVGR